LLYNINIMHFLLSHLPQPWSTNKHSINLQSKSKVNRPLTFTLQYRDQTLAPFILRNYSQVSVEDILPFDCITYLSAYTNRIQSAKQLYTFQISMSFSSFSLANLITSGWALKRKMQYPTYQTQSRETSICCQNL